MATLAAEPASPRGRPAGRTRFYFWLSLACLAIGVGGFTPTYWLQIPAGGFTGTPLMHIHALVFTAWLLLLVGQNWRIAQGRLDHHRAWGLAGIALATMMLAIGTTTAVVGLSERIAEGFGDRGRSFLIVPLFSIVAFYALFVAAMANLRRPEWHKRLIFMATSVALVPAVARLFLVARQGFSWGMRAGAFPPAPISASLMAFSLTSAIPLTGMIYDWRTRGRPHPAWIVGFAAVTVGMLLRPLVATTSAWLAFAEWTQHIAR